MGIGFAIPINTAKKLLPKLREGGQIERAYLGVEMSAVTSQLKRDLNLAADQGALVTCVVKGGPADKAGIRGGRTGTTAGIPAGGDLIVEVDGKKASTPEDVSRASGATSRATRVEVVYYRGNDRKSTKVKLGKRPSSSQRRRLRQQATQSRSPERSAGLPLAPVTRVKICGITSLDDARRAPDLGAWAIGMIFWPGSPRALHHRGRRADRRAAAPAGGGHGRVRERPRSTRWRPPPTAAA